MHVLIEVPGDSAEYYVPIAKIVKYSIEEIFDKKLFILIPFYIFIFEDEFFEYNNSEDKLEDIKREYRRIIEKLNDLVDSGEITTFDKRTIIELSDNVIHELTKKYVKLQKGVGELMSGAMIETEARKLRDEGISHGIGQGKLEICIEMIKDGLISVKDAAIKLHMSEEALKSHIK